MIIRRIRITIISMAEGTCLSRQREIESDGNSSFLPLYDRLLNERKLEF